MELWAVHAPLGVPRLGQPQGTAQLDQLAQAGNFGDFTLTPWLSVSASVAWLSTSLSRSSGGSGYMAFPAAKISST